MTILPNKNENLQADPELIIDEGRSLVNSDNQSYDSKLLDMDKIKVESMDFSCQNQDLPLIPKLLAINTTLTNNDVKLPSSRISQKKAEGKITLGRLISNLEENSNFFTSGHQTYSDCGSVNSYMKGIF